MGVSWPERKDIKCKPWPKTFKFLKTKYYISADNLWLFIDCKVDRIQKYEPNVLIKGSEYFYYKWHFFFSMIESNMHIYITYSDSNYLAFVYNCQRNVSH